MSGDADDRKREVAAEVWRLFFAFLIKTRHSRDRVLEEFELTPVDAKALHALSPGEGKPMGALADEWMCDASNATWMVDRLEERGLAERHVSPVDRRVKLVSLKQEGEAIKQKLHERLHEPPEDLLDLSYEDLQQLRDALAKLPVDEHQPPQW